MTQQVTIIIKKQSSEGMRVGALRDDPNNSCEVRLALALTGQSVILGIQIPGKPKKLLSIIFNSS